MSSNNKHKTADKSNTPKKFENRARQAAAIASYADQQEPSNKKSISDEARQKVARIFDVFDGKWKKEDILRSLEEHDFDEQATIWAKTEGKDEWKDVPSKRRVEPQKKFKKPIADDENADGSDSTQATRGRGGFRGGRGGRGRGTRGGYRGGKPTSYADRASYKSTNYRDNQQQQQQVVEEAPAIVTPAKPLYSEIAKKRKELDELAAAEKLAKEQQVVEQQQPTIVAPEPTQDQQAATKKQPRNKKKKPEQQQQQQPQQEEAPVALPEESPYGEDEPVAPVAKPKKLTRKFVAQQQPEQQETTVVADTQEVAQQVEEEEPEVVLPNTQYNNIDLKFGAFADGEAAPVEVASPAVTQEVAPAPATTTTSNTTTQTSQYGYGAWNQQPSQPAHDNYFYDDKTEVAQQQQQGDAPQTGKQQQQQQFKGYPQQTFMPQQYHQYGYPYHPYMMNFQYQGGYPNPSKPYPYYAQKNMYAYPSYGTQPATNAQNQAYPYPDPETAADYGKYQNVPAFYGMPPQQQAAYHDAPTKQTRGGPQQAQGTQTGKDKRGQPTSEDFAAYNNYMHHYNYAMAYPYQQGYPPQQQQQQQQQHRGAPHQQGKGDWNPAYNQAQ